MYLYCRDHKTFPQAKISLACNQRTLCIKVEYYKNSMQCKSPRVESFSQGNIQQRIQIDLSKQHIWKRMQYINSVKCKHSFGNLCKSARSSKQGKELYFPTIRTTCKWTITAKSPHTFSSANKYDKDLYFNFYKKADAFYKVIYCTRNFGHEFPIHSKSG